MTANARIITAEQEDVLKVPLQALRFSPNGAGKGDNPAHRHGDHTASLWVLEGKTLRQIQVARGLDDGTSVQIVSGALKPGDQVVIDESTAIASGKRPHLTQPGMGGLHHF
jgi:HlyD family secretion protein